MFTAFHNVSAADIATDGKRMPCYVSVRGNHYMEFNGILRYVTRICQRGIMDERYEHDDSIEELNAELQHKHNLYDQLWLIRR